MEQPSDHSDDRDRDIPELEKWEPSDIDLTGVIRQEDALRDVIGDAIVEAESSGGNIPDWGARTIARALANRLDTPISALHHFATTGRADRDRVLRELAELATHTTDDEVREWANWLGPYVISLPDEADLTELTGSGTQIQPVPPVEATTHPDNPQIAEGLREHGDAFRAYLQLSDVDPGRDDLLRTFHELYVGAFDSMEMLLNELTEIRDWQRAIDEVTRAGGFDGFVVLDHAKIEAVARETWDIIEIGGSFYVFTK